MIGLRGVTKVFGEQVVLDGLDLALEPGRVTALTGPNGSGKTTIGRLLLGLERPDAGEVVGVAGLRRAAVFQEDRLCEALTAVRNVQVVTGRDPRAGDLLRRLGLVDEDLAKPVGELSGGQRRRVAIARALAVDAELVVLDEPFTGLDVAGKPQVAAVVGELCAGRTVLLITHDVADAEVFGAAVVGLL